jgi:hypothetical protein
MGVDYVACALAVQILVMCIFIMGLKTMKLVCVTIKFRKAQKRGFLQKINILNVKCEFEALERSPVSQCYQIFMCNAYMLCVWLLSESDLEKGCNKILS